MFFKSVTLPANHWSWRLLHSVFPSVHRYNNFCPHFWLTILAMLLFIPVLIKKVLVFFINIIVNPILLFFDIIEEFFADKKMKSDLRLRAKYEEEWEKLSIDEKLLAIEAYNQIYSKKYFKHTHPVEKCFKKKLLHYSKMLDIAHKYEFYYGLTSMDVLDSARMCQRRNDVFYEALSKHTHIKPVFEHLRTQTRTAAETTELRIKWAKIGVTILICILSPIIAFIIYKIIVYIPLVIGWLWSAVLWCFYGCGYVIYWIQYFIAKNSTEFIILAVLISITIFFVKFPETLLIISRKLFPKTMFDYLRCIAWERKILKVKKFIGFILLPLSPIGRFLGVVIRMQWAKEICKFLWLGLKTFKADNCPELIWKEETKK